MKKSNFSFSFSSIHFIGIGGVSMSALALYCLGKNKRVSGSDFARNDMIKTLKEKGVKIYKTQNTNGVKNADVVVYSSAINDKNKDMVLAKRLNKTLLKRSEFLGGILKEYKTSVAISGSHGKTTATAMLCHVLSAAGKEPTAFIGGLDYEYNNLAVGKKEIAIAETCEYKKNILDIKPDLAVILNIDNDHLDSYSNMQDMVSVFTEFSKNSVAFINEDDGYCKNLPLEYCISFGIKNNASYTAKNVKYNGKGYSFTVYAYGIRRGRINLCVFGKHNIYNALAAVAVADFLHTDFKAIKAGLERFKGVKRRMEHIGICSGAQVFCDYAHHPKELQTVLSQTDLSNTLIVFQPHTYSRTRILMKDFVNVLLKCDNLIVYKTYSAREKEDASANAFCLYNNIICAGGKAEYAKTKEELKLKIKKYANLSKILFLGAGDIYDVAREIVGE